MSHDHGDFSSRVANPDDRQLLEDVLSGELESFSHRQHVRFAWILLQHAPWDTAIVVIRQALFNFARAKGVDQYHETITIAFSLVILERIESAENGAANSCQFIQQHPDLLAGISVVKKHYHADVLESGAAKSGFIPPAGIEPPRWLRRWSHSATAPTFADLPPVDGKENSPAPETRN